LLASIESCFGWKCIELPREESGIELAIISTSRLLTLPGGELMELLPRNMIALSSSPRCSHEWATAMDNKSGLLGQQRAEKFGRRVQAGKTFSQWHLVRHRTVVTPLARCKRMEFLGRLFPSTTTTRLSEKFFSKKATQKGIQLRFYLAPCASLSRFSHKQSPLCVPFRVWSGPWAKVWLAE
jgi:hypothetical protein